MILVHTPLVIELGRCSYFPMIFGHYPNTKYPKLILLHIIFNALSRPFSHDHRHLTKGGWGLGTTEEHFKQLLIAIYLQEIIFFFPLFLSSTHLHASINLIYLSMLSVFFPSMFLVQKGQ